MFFEACDLAAAYVVAVPRKQGLDRNRPGWRDNQLRDWERTLSLVPHGFKPLLSLSLSLSPYGFQPLLACPPLRGFGPLPRVISWP